MKEVVEHLTVDHEITKDILDEIRVYAAWGANLPFFEAFDISIRDGDVVEFLESFHLTLHEEEYENG